VQVAAMVVVGWGWVGWVAGATLRLRLYVHVASFARYDYSAQTGERAR